MSVTTLAHKQVTPGGIMITNLPVVSTQMTWQYIATSQQMEIFCLLPSAFCLLPSAFCLLPSAFCLLPMFHQSVQPFAIGKSARLSLPETKTGTVVFCAGWTAGQRREAAQQQQW
jgi:hypothetical protein